MRFVHASAKQYELENVQPFLISAVASASVWQLARIKHSIFAFSKETTAPLPMCLGTDASLA